MRRRRFLAAFSAVLAAPLLPRPAEPAPPRLQAVSPPGEPVDPPCFALSAVVRVGEGYSRVRFAYAGVERYRVGLYGEAPRVDWIGGSVVAPRGCVARFGPGHWEVEVENGALDFADVTELKR